jgi:hypothetical protein
VSFVLTVWPEVVASPEISIEPFSVIKRKHRFAKMPYFDDEFEEQHEGILNSNVVSKNASIINLENRSKILLKMSEETILEIYATQQHTSVTKNRARVENRSEKHAEGWSECILN